ncbi:hypothetical protein E2320_019686, partial [Naja naja]
MAQYRFMFLKKDTIALAPLDNYQKSKKSFSACLMYIEHTEGINIQYALQGGEKQVGRTNATCLYYKPKQGGKILYYDFTSLYPVVNKNKVYPIGHPEIIYQNFRDIKQYFGFAKVKVYTPRGLYFL